MNEEKPKTESLEKIKKNAGEKKRLPGRPKGTFKKSKEKAPEAAKPIEADEKETFLASSIPIIENALDWLFKSIFAPRLGEHWILTPDEAKEGGQVFGALIIKYAPAVNKFAEELAAGGWTAKVCLPRYQKSVELMEAEIKAKMAEAPEGHEPIAETQDALGGVEAEQPA